MFSHIDYPVAALIGFFFGIFLIPTLFNLGARDQVILLVLPWISAALFVFGMWIAALFSRFISFIPQFSRFLAVGFLNTAIDFGVLNLLSAATGITSGLVIGGVNLPGFAVAVSNSYLWNKFWVFADREGTLFSDLPKFLAVTGSAALLNSGIIALITTTPPSFFALSPAVVLNLAKAGATALTLVWNFFGYKFFVFRSALPKK